MISFTEKLFQQKFFVVLLKVRKFLKRNLLDLSVIVPLMSVKKSSSSGPLSVMNLMNGRPVIIIATGA